MAWMLLSIAGVLEIAFAFDEVLRRFTRLMPALLTVAPGCRASFCFPLRSAPCRSGRAMRYGPASAQRARRFSVSRLGDSAAPMRIFCITLILAGVIGLRLVSGD